MSWSVEFVAKSKQDALAAVDGEVCKYIPDQVKSILKSCIWTQGEAPEGYGYIVRSNGHMETGPCTYGACVASVNVIRLVQ